MNAFLEAVSTQLNLRWAWEKVRREARPGDVWFDEVELAGFELELERNLHAIGTELRKGSYSMAPLRPLPFPKHPDKDGNPRVRQSFQVAVRDQVAWTAVVNVVGPDVDSRMPAWSYGNRLYRSIWVKEDEDGTKRRQIGNYRHASGRLFLPFTQSWPIFRRHVYLSTRAMTSAHDLPDLDERTEEELQLQHSLSKEQQGCPFVSQKYWEHTRPKVNDVPLYWCSIDLENFYPTLGLAGIRDNIVEALPPEWSDDAWRLLESMLRFPLDTSEWDSADLKKMNLLPNRKTFRHVPTGLYVAGFLANAALMKVDDAVVHRLNHRKIAHFRFVDDHIILAYNFDELVQWIDEYVLLLHETATGARVNHEKIEPKALAKWFSVRKQKKRIPSSMDSLEKAAKKECELDPKFPSPLMTKTLALVSGIARTDFNLLETSELVNLTEQVEHLLLVDIPDEEIPEKTRLSFAASRLSRIAECRISNNDVTVNLNRRRKELNDELERKTLEEERRRELKNELDAVNNSWEKENDALQRDVNRAFQLFRKVLRERPDRVRLWTRAILMCRLTGVKGLRDIVDDIKRERLENPLAGEYLLANMLALLGGQALVATRISRDRNAAQWRRNAATAFLEDIRDTQDVLLNVNPIRRWFLRLSWAQYCCGLHCASLVLEEQSSSSITSPSISFRRDLLLYGKKCTLQGVEDRAPEKWVWWSARMTLRDLSIHPAAFVKELGTHLSPNVATFTFWRFFPFDVPMPVLIAMARKERKKNDVGAPSSGWWIDALRNRPEVVEELSLNKSCSEVRSACRMLNAERNGAISLYDWCRFLKDLQGVNPTDPRGGEWTALEITRQIAVLIQQVPEFGPSYVKQARKGSPGLPQVHPANFWVPAEWMENHEPSWENWKNTKVRKAGGCCVHYVKQPARIADARYTPLYSPINSLFESVNPVRGLGLILYGLLRCDFALPAIWNGPGHADVLLRLPHLLMGSMTCSSWTMGVLQGCLLPRVTENQFLKQSPLSKGPLDDDTLQDPPMFFSAAEVSAALRICQRVLERHQLSTLNHRARQLIPVNIRQLANPEWGKVFSSEDLQEEHS